MEYELNAELPGLKQAGFILATASLASQRLSRNYWIITNKYGNGYFDVQKESALIYNFSSSTGLVDSGSSTNEDLTKYSYVLCILPGAKYLDVGDVVKLGFYSNNLKRPYIKQIIRSHTGKESLTPARGEYDLWVQAYGNPGFTRSRASDLWDPDATPTTLWTGTNAFAAVPLGAIFGGGFLITAQPGRNEANTAWDKVTLHLLKETPETYQASVSPSPAFFVGYGDMWCSSAGDFVLVRLGPHLQPLYRLRNNVFEQLTLLNLGSRVLSGANMTSSKIFVLGDCSRNFTSSSTGITLNFGGSPWPTLPVETIPAGTLVEDIQAWNADTSLTSLSEAWAVDPTDPTFFELTDSYIITGASTRLASHENLLMGAYAFRKRPVPSEDGDYGLAVLWGWDATLPGGNWSGDKLTENNDSSRNLKAYLTAFVASTGAVSWKREVSIDTATLPVISDSSLLTPMSTFLEENVSAPDVYAGTVSEAQIPNFSNGEGLLQPSTTNFNLPYKRFVYKPKILLFPSSRNSIAPTDLDGNLNNFEVFHSWLPEAGGTGEVVVDSNGNSFWAYAAPVEFLSAVGNLSRDETLLGIFDNRSLTNQPVSTVNEDLSYTLYHNPDYFPMTGRFVEKVSPSGALVWKADLTQRVTGAAWYYTKAQLGVASSDIVGGESSTGHPLGDNIQWVRPCGRVVFVAADFHSLGPNHSPTLKLVVLDNSNGTVLHTIPLYLNDSLVASDIYVTGTENATGNGVDTYFNFSVSEIASVSEVRINGSPTLDYNLYIESTYFDIEFFTAPDDGAAIEVDYVSTTLLHRAGDYFYDVQAAEMRGGITPQGTEFAVVSVSQISRELNPLSYPRTLLVEIGVDKTAAPSVSTYSKSWTSFDNTALVNGAIVDFSWTGSAWTIKAN